MIGSFNPKGILTHRLRTTAVERSVHMPLTTQSYSFPFISQYPLIGPEVLTCPPSDKSEATEDHLTTFHQVCYFFYPLLIHVATTLWEPCCNPPPPASIAFHRGENLSSERLKDPQLRSAWACIPRRQMNGVQELCLCHPQMRYWSLVPWVPHSVTVSGSRVLYI